MSGYAVTPVSFQWLDDPTWRTQGEVYWQAHHETMLFVVDRAGVLRFAHEFLCDGRVIDGEIKSLL